MCSFVIFFLYIVGACITCIRVHEGVMHTLASLKCKVTGLFKFWV